MPTTIRQRLVNYIARGMSPENPSTPLTAIAKWLNAGNTTVSGESINETIALQITTVRTCVTVLSESIASLPCRLYERTEKGSIEAISSPLHFLLTVEPNDEMSAFTFWETMVGGNALTGNSYAEIMWTPQNQVGELYPLNPLMTEPYRLPTGQIGYRTRQGTKDSAIWRHIDAENILHFRLFSFDGLKGLSPITLMRQSLGLSRAAEKFGAKFFGSGSKPGGVLTGPDEMDETELVDAREAWEAAQGASNQGRTAVLSGEWKYQQIGLSPEDSQFLATRSFQRADLAAAFRVPAHMAGDTTKMAGSAWGDINLMFVNDTLRPIAMRIENECNRKLLHRVGAKANKYFVKFDFSERLRADHETTMKGIALGRQWSLMTVDEGRLALGMNPIGDSSRLAPINMMNADLIPTQDTIPGSPGPNDSQAANTDNNAPINKKSQKPKNAPSEEVEESETDTDVGE